MFGKRGDGYLVKNIDPIIALMPYLMPTRNDAQVMMTYKIDYERMARYLAEKGRDGYRITFMELFIASYVRAISQLPELNRFIINKRTYTRKDIVCSFAVLQDTTDGSVKENVAKCKFDPHDTIFDVAARIKAAIDQTRKEDASNSTLKVAGLLKKPLIANTIVFLGRLLDRYGLLPRYLLDASPFHTGLFFSNNASIGLPPVYHHIYNFGTTSLFVVIGNVERVVELDAGGTPVRKRIMPAGVTADERVCAGMVYSKFLRQFQHFLHNPQELEAPPEQVYFDEGHVISLPPVKKAKIRTRFRSRLGRLRPGRKKAS
ncbi:MAG TPA: 2-oxo acid dehydrogenase subunit E2 [Clostridia bacterium]|nr:2-oxo acid dehydrogenase subunit E2 [Clostridia bacterium]